MYSLKSFKIYDTPTTKNSIAMFIHTYLKITRKRNTVKTTQFFYLESKLK